MKGINLICAAVSNTWITNTIKKVIKNYRIQEEVEFKKLELLMASGQEVEK